MLKVEDEELLHLAEKRKVPLFHRDPILGKLKLDRDSECFEAKKRWSGLVSFVWLTLPAQGESIPDRILSFGKELWKDRQAWNERMREFAACKLLETKNESWVDDDEGEGRVTHEQFKKRMRLERIAIESDGTILFFYQDRNLFYGHTITVAGNFENGPTSASI